MIIEGIVIGIVAGLVAGLLGVGGGILFVPALILVSGLDQVDAEATSLLAILPVALIGTWRQRKYGNLQLKAAIIIGVLSLAGVFIGVYVANVLPQRTLQLAFAGLLVVVAAQIVRRVIQGK